MRRTAPTEQVSTAAIDKLGAKPYRTRFPTNDEQDAELARSEGRIAQLESAIRREVALLPIEYARGLRAVLACKHTRQLEKMPPICMDCGEVIQ